MEHDKITQSVEEFIKCKKDPTYFIENYVQLELPGANTLMKMYEPQKRFLRSILEDHHVIALKSRQTGISTIAQAMICYTFTFYKNVVVGIASKDGPEATDFCRKVMSMLKNLPDFLKPEFKKETEQTFILKNGCKLYASPINPMKPGGLFRGKAITIAVIDEAAHIAHLDEAFTGFGPALLKAQNVAKQRGIPYGTFIISTPNRTIGIGKWFYERWCSAQESDSIYTPHKIHWSDIDEFKNDPDWYKTQCEILEKKDYRIRQELELEFIASQSSFFDAKTIETLNRTPIPPVTQLNIKGNVLYMWKKPSQDRFVLIGVDTAPSSGNDASAMVLTDYETLEQVGEYKGKLRVDDFCEVIETTCRIYPKHLLIIENNTYGNQVIEHMTKTRVQYNLYKQKIKNVDYAEYSRFQYGLSTNAATRPLIIDSLYSYIKEDPSIIKSPRLALELIGLEQKARYKGIRVEAAQGEHDDLAMAFGFCCYVRMYDTPLESKSLGSEIIMEDIESITDFNFEDSGLFGSSLAAIKAEESNLSKHSINRMVGNHIKERYFELTQGTSSKLDIRKLMGFDVQSE